jgi:hypothetical protein
MRESKPLWSPFSQQARLDPNFRSIKGAEPLLFPFHHYLFYLFQALPVLSPGSPFEGRRAHYRSDPLQAGRAFRADAELEGRLTEDEVSILAVKG